jgi:hypothetical protein
MCSLGARAIRARITSSTRWADLGTPRRTQPIGRAVTFGVIAMFVALAWLASIL